MTRDLEKFAFENNCSKWREIWLLARRVELMASTPSNSKHVKLTKDVSLLDASIANVLSFEKLKGDTIKKEQQTLPPQQCTPLHGELGRENTIMSEADERDRLWCAYLQEI